MTQTQQEIAASIGQFFLQQNNGDYKETAKQIQAMNITKLDVLETRKNSEPWQKEIEITTSRPGLLIGKRGTTIDELTKWLDESHQVKHVKIIEDRDCLQNWLIPEEYSIEDDFNTMQDIDDFATNGVFARLETEDRLKSEIEEFEKI